MDEDMAFSLEGKWLDSSLRQPADTEATNAILLTHARIFVAPMGEAS
jgi:hypothetical protein